MKVIEGNISKEEWSLSTDKAFLVSTLHKQKIGIVKNVASVDILTEEKARGLTGAAAGAILGFLIAGPIGTAVGAGIGAGGKNQVHASVLLLSGESFIATMSHSEFQSLKTAQMSTTKALHPPQSTDSTTTHFKADQQAKKAPAKTKKETTKKKSSNLKKQAVIIENNIDSKECPMCAETVKARAKICRFCRHTFDDMDTPK